MKQLTNGENILTITLNKENLHMLRYQRLGFENMKEMQYAWKTIQDRIPEMGTICPSPAAGLYDDITTCYDILFYQHLQTSHPFGTTAKYAEKGIELCREYFFGNWRDSYQRFYYSPILTRDECRHQTPWVSSLTYSFLLSLLFNDTKSLLTFAGYVGDDLPDDYSDYYGKVIQPQYIAYWKVLTYGVKNKTLVGCEDQKSMIENSSRRIYKLLLICLESLFSNNIVLFKATFTKYMVLFIKNVTNPINKMSKYSYYYMSLDGSILWNYANNVLNLSMTEFSEEIMDRIVTSNSCSLQK